MSRSVKLFAIAVLAVLVMLSVQSAVAATLDQKSETGTGSLNIIFYDPIGQEFQPSLPILEAIEVGIRNPSSSSTGTITLTLRQGSVTGSVLATAAKTITLNAGEEQWIRFELGSVSVTIGSTYVIRLTATSDNFVWLVSDINPYSKGTAITTGSALTDYDFNFRTYGSTSNPTAPVGGFMQPVNKLGVVTPYLALFGLVAVVAVVVWKKRET